MFSDELSAVTLDLRKNPLGDDGAYRIDRRHVPLCGRDLEQVQLSNLYNDVTRPPTTRNSSSKSRAVIIRGTAGAGKSALVESLRGSVSESTWFVTGKFCQYADNNNPFSALVETITDLIDLITQHSSTELYEKGVKAAISRHESAFARLVPNLGKLTLEEYKVSSIIKAPHQQIHAFAQFKVAFSTLLCALGRPEHPLVMFLDDLQWMDDESLDVIKEFVGKLSSSKHILLIGAVRTDETRGPSVVEALDRAIHESSSSHDMILPGTEHFRDDDDVTTDEKEATSLTYIDVGNVDEASVAQIISLAIEVPFERCQSLGNIVHQKTMGNPFAVLQFMDWIISEGKMEHRNGDWRWDEELIRSETDVSENVLQVVERNLERIPKQLKGVLVLASFLGFTFDRTLLIELTEHTIGSGQSDQDQAAHLCIDSCIALSLKQGFIEELVRQHQDGSMKYKFSHDKVRQALYDSVSEAESRRLHLTIGMYLRQHHAASVDDHSLDVANHLNRARTLMLSSSEDRFILVVANYAAAKLAIERSAFSSSVSFLQIALRTLDYDIKWTEKYDLALAMSTLLLEMCVACGKEEEVDLVAEEVLQHARCLDDKLPVLLSKVVLLWSTCRYREAVNYGADVLKLLGERPAKKPSPLYILSLFLRARQRVNRLSDDEILKMKIMDDESVDFKLEIYSWLAPCALFAGSEELTMQFMLRAAILSFDHGVQPTTPLAICHIGIAEFGFGNFETAFRNGRLAIQLANDLSSAVAQTYVATYANIGHWTEPLGTISDHFKRGMEAGMAAGDIIWAYQSYANSVYVDLFNGVPLEVIERNTRDLCSKMSEFQMQGGLFIAKVFWQYCLNLMGASEQSTVLTGEAIHEEAHLNNPMIQDSKWQSTIFVAAKFLLARLLGQAEKAERLAKELEKGAAALKWSYVLYETKFQTVLLWFRLASENSTRKRKYLGKAKTIVNYMKKMRGFGCPNFDNALLLCEAEEASLSKSKSVEEVSRLYDAAIAKSAGTGNVQHEAVATEHAALFHIRRSNMEEAQAYYIRAMSKYAEWNAFVKVEEMELKFNELFSLGHDDRQTVNLTVVVPGPVGFVREE